MVKTLDCRMGRSGPARGRKNERPHEVCRTPTAAGRAVRRRKRSSADAACANAGPTLSGRPGHDACAATDDAAGAVRSTGRSAHAVCSAGSSAGTGSSTSTRCSTSTRRSASTGIAAGVRSHTRARSAGGASARGPAGRRSRQRSGQSRGWKQRACCRDSSRPERRTRGGAAPQFAENPELATSHLGPLAFVGSRFGGAGYLPAFLHHELLLG